MATAKTLTQILHDNKKDGESITQCAARLRIDGETLSETANRLVSTDGVKLIKPISISFKKIKEKGMKISWTGQDIDVKNYIIKVTSNGEGIGNSPFIMAGGTLTKSVSGLDAGTEYEVTVSAIGEDGDIIVDACASQETLTGE